jgi:hypothetical protein
LRSRARREIDTKKALVLQRLGRSSFTGREHGPQR